MTVELQAAIENAYTVFSPHRISGALVVCHCNCCMTEADERELTGTPLRQIRAGLLAEYTNSAHGWDDDAVAREMRHFLPRYFELIAAGDPPDNLGLDICLRRLGYARWRETWPRAEAEAIALFFDAFIVASLDRLELAHWPAGWRLDFDFVDVLTLIVTAGGDIDRALVVWDAHADPAAAIHMAALRQDVIHATGGAFLHSPYLDEHRDAAGKIGAFLMGTEVSDRIEAAFFAVADPRLQLILSDGR